MRDGEADIRPEGKQNSFSFSLMAVRSGLGSSGAHVIESKLVMLAT